LRQRGRDTEGEKGRQSQRGKEELKGQRQRDTERKFRERDRTTEEETEKQRQIGSDRFVEPETKSLSGIALEDVHCPKGSKMEFLDINVTIDSSLLLPMLFTVFLLVEFKKTRLYSGFKNTYKKNRRTRKLSSGFE
jgi:hypothetical protein